MVTAYVNATAASAPHLTRRFSLGQSAMHYNLNVLIMTDAPSVSTMPPTTMVTGPTTLSMNAIKAVARLITTFQKKFKLQWNQKYKKHIVETEDELSTNAEICETGIDERETGDNLRCKLKYAVKSNIEVEGHQAGDDRLHLVVVEQLNCPEERFIIV